MYCTKRWRKETREREKERIKKKRLSSYWKVKYPSLLFLNVHVVDALFAQDAPFIKGWYSSVYTKRMRFSKQNAHGYMNKISKCLVVERLWLALCCRVTRSSIVLNNNHSSTKEKELQCRVFAFWPPEEDLLKKDYLRRGLKAKQCVYVVGDAAFSYKYVEDGPFPSDEQL